MAGTVGRESDPEETGRDKDTAGLAHHKPEFRQDVGVLLCLSERKPTRNRQLCGKEKAVWLISVPKCLLLCGDSHTDIES